MKTAILIPCYNEEKTIGSVVSSFREQLPGADIYVYGNNSTDNSVEEAKRAGAIVRFEKKQGKGNVVRAMFSEIDADYFVMVDGDGTYPAERLGDLMQPLIKGDADMVIGARLHPTSESHFKWINFIGNKLFVYFLNFIFGVKIIDLLSGYRAFNRDVVKSIPIVSRGFEIETEITIRCLEHNYRIVEVPVDLMPRHKDSRSKIKYFRDGLLILNTIFFLFRDYKPLTAFGSIGLIFMSSGLILSGVFMDYIKADKGLYLSVFATGLILAGFISFAAGFIIHAISRRFQELNYRLQLIDNSAYKGLSSKIKNK
ncbi:MAG TPA: glycosyl transferase [Nitrospiraceae bacterium]|nr:MAG: hypothetical protein A2Z82_03305 [Nitrospirae bacterium GWA2_46_11]OGW23695.1 MAG: hypothetical protein A2X55_03840 [Nitrospirae bacterium GWB2_47_37]HAK89184.1 glycosyl transferase [Nitrospiraceae bacterium]HCZ11466.1 glycosyl transferase [Nitrospiraceae bacterium]